jgi:Xaa-Pro dipeptidase
VTNGESLSQPQSIDMDAMRMYRYSRVQQKLRENRCAAALLSNPINIRYATDSRNMTVWLLHNEGRYCLIPAEGRAVLFEYPNANCLRRAPPLPAIGEIRLAKCHAFQYAGTRAEEVSVEWAKEIADTLRALMGTRSHRVAVDRCDLMGYRALEAAEIVVVEGQPIMELARSIKSAEEIACMRHSIAVTELGMTRMHEALRPGISENELWAQLHQTNIAFGGEWIETRLLTSGPRTNPWFQECSDRRIQSGELVAFDTDLVGPYGYCADLSRTFHCGPGRPTEYQRELYRYAAEQIAHNCGLLRPRLTFQECREAAWPIPTRFQTQNYGSAWHGVGMVDEWPDPSAQDGVLMPGMVLCVESYIGEVDGAEGVKLEEQVLITDTGHEILSRFPLEASLM